MKTINHFKLNLNTSHVKKNSILFSEMLHENYAKRTRGWVALRGMWGKRSDPMVPKNSSNPEVSKKAPIPKVTEEEAQKILEQ